MTEDPPASERAARTRAGLKFPRKSRLTRPSQFKRVFGHGARFRNRFFTLRCISSGSGEPRLGLAVSRKCAKLAVQRHRIKRIVRESFRRRRSTLPAMDYIVQCAPGAARLSNEELNRSLSGLWKRSAQADRARHGKG